MCILDGLGKYMLVIFYYYDMMYGFRLKKDKHGASNVWTTIIFTVTCVLSLNLMYFPVAIYLFNVKTEKLSHNK